ncbi:heterokaryon incompatibility protein-domain-containing protein [Xylariales sp. PMI_506]|nr:heterokaryon incompatibility protein-domain-containing protein [Xylariales sp. PMI_506]
MGETIARTTLQYIPLDPSRSEVRLLTILPGRHDAELRCLLAAASLDDQPRYEALSYVWGDPQRLALKDITVNGTPVSITANLASGLRRLRQRRARRTIWVDAVCINQADPTEKNHQIPLMSRLYESAEAVVIWLGEPGSGDLQLFAERASARYVERSTAAVLRRLGAYLRALISAEHRFTRHIDSLHVAQGMYELLGHEYFYRMWTFQEYLLNPKEPVFLVGKTVLRLDKIMPHLFDMLSSETAALADILSRRPQYEDSPNTKLRDLWRQTQNFLSMEDRAKRIPIQTYASKTFSVRLAISMRGFERSMYSLLVQTADRACSDPRDRIYALYGLNARIQAALPPDYTKPIDQVVLETVAYMVNYEQKGHQVLASIFPLRPERLETAAHPSWLPDLTHQLRKVPRRNLEWSLSGKARAVPIRVSYDLKTLHLPVWALGHCKVVLIFETTLPRLFVQVASLIRTSEVAGVPSQEWMAGLRRKDLLPQRLARACYYHDKQVPFHETEDILSTYKIIARYAEKRRLKQFKWGSSGAARDMRPTSRTLAGKALIVTESGEFGICSGQVADGDVVAVSAHLGQPMVLRKEEQVQKQHERQGTDKQQEFYRIVDWAFIDGLDIQESQDSEMVKELKSRDLVSMQLH